MEPSRNERSVNDRVIGVTRSCVPDDDLQSIVADEARHDDARRARKSHEAVLHGDAGNGQYIGSSGAAEPEAASRGCGGLYSRHAVVALHEVAVALEPEHRLDLSVVIDALDRVAFRF